LGFTVLHSDQAIGSYYKFTSCLKVRLEPSQETSLGYILQWQAVWSSNSSFLAKSLFYDVGRRLILKVSSRPIRQQRTQIHRSCWCLLMSNPFWDVRRCVGWIWWHWNGSLFEGIPHRFVADLIPADLSNPVPSPEKQGIPILRRFYKAISVDGHIRHFSLNASDSVALTYPLLTQSS